MNNIIKYGNTNFVKEGGGVGQSRISKLLTMLLALER